LIPFDKWVNGNTPGNRQILAFFHPYLHLTVPLVLVTYIINMLSERQMLLKIFIINLSINNLLGEVCGTKRRATLISALVSSPPTECFGLVGT